MQKTHSCILLHSRHWPKTTTTSMITYPQYIFSRQSMKTFTSLFIVKRELHCGQKIYLGRVFPFRDSLEKGTERRKTEKR